ncbi:hypothetical protein ATCV1_z351R [Acanthocystis turfacea chlorella virus 1]|uniref:Uncharacterized protein z351R n=1 Tax=Chlorovirus heliozoae TaxID=322019 RepID=A7K8W1_9PHYC|nr:hypothetical protein ATCV1_z351R [Acanthocystis turfacea chlorella virus 1]ABT16485.1 hypothetical protein ATCV1_z351R [Acanthocystis turfacea chlorella virus 1]
MLFLFILAVGYPSWLILRRSPLITFSVCFVIHFIRHIFDICQYPLEVLDPSTSFQTSFGKSSYFLYENPFAPV